MISTFFSFAGSYLPVILLVSLGVQEVPRACYKCIHLFLLCRFNKTCIHMGKGVGEEGKGGSNGVSGRRGNLLRIWYFIFKFINIYLSRYFLNIHLIGS